METWCPDGYVSFDALINELYREGGFHEKWSTPDNPQKNKRSMLLFEDHLDWIKKTLHLDRPFSMLEDRIIVMVGLFGISREILKTVGVDLETGDLLRLPKAVWDYSRKSSGHADYNGKMLGDLFLGNNIAVPSVNDGFVICRPLIELRSLAVLFEASNLPAEPEILPKDWEIAPAISVRKNASLPVSVASPVSNNAAAAIYWMQGYVKAMNMNGVKPKREDTLQLCCKETSCRYREAQVAWQALPKDSKNHSRQSPDVIR